MILRGEDMKKKDKAYSRYGKSMQYLDRLDFIFPDGVPNKAKLLPSAIGFAGDLLTVPSESLVFRFIEADCDKNYEETYKIAKKVYEALGEVLPKRIRCMKEDEETWKEFSHLAAEEIEIMDACRNGFFEYDNSDECEFTFSMNRTKLWDGGGG